jgi:hypothetical protein
MQGERKAKARERGMRTAPSLPLTVQALRRLGSRSAGALDTRRLQPR